MRWKEIAIAFAAFRAPELTDSFSSHSVNRKRNLRKWSNTNIESRRIQYSSSRDLYSVNENKSNEMSGRNNPVQFVRRMIQQLSLAYDRRMQWFSRLSKKAKILLVMQLLVLMTMFGKLVHSHASNRIVGRSVMTISRRARPQTIPYSSFMDLAEKNGLGSVNMDNMVGINNQLFQNILTVLYFCTSKVIASDRILFSIQEESSIPKNYYTMKTSANPELLQFLRKNKLSFRAASTAANKTIGRTIRSAVIVIYLMFLLRMYQVMSGSGGSNNFTAKLFGKKQVKKSQKGDLISFEDIEGIDDAKLNVMEFVDTLRNPAKYAILGARAPTGLLLVGPSGKLKNDCSSFDMYFSK